MEFNAKFKGDLVQIWIPTRPDCADRFIGCVKMSDRGLPYFVGSAKFKSLDDAVAHLIKIIAH
jgi:hypothetical protein